MTFRGDKMETNLGTIELSADILDKANIGLWAFELDEGCEPRMYVDDAMLKLIGLSEQIAPEATYHAWFDGVDHEHVDTVNAAVDKMVNGKYSEVQYPWHFPNGMIKEVRCGGVRNYAYTKGIRVEGTHQSISGIEHLEKKKVDELTNIVKVLSADYECVLHVDFNSMQEEHYRTSDSISKILPHWRQVYDYRKRVNMLAEQVVIKEDRERFLRESSPEVVSEKIKDGKPYFINFRIEIDGSVVWFQAKYTHHSAHKDTNCALVAIYNNDASIHKSMRERAILGALGSDFDYISYVDWVSEQEEIFKFDEEFIKSIPEWKETDDYSDRIKIIANTWVYEADREEFLKETEVSNLKKILSEKSIYYITFREEFAGKVFYYRGKYVLLSIDGEQKIVVGYRNVDEEVKGEKEQQERLKLALDMAEAANRAKTTFLNNMSHDIRTPMNAIIGYTGLAATHIDKKELVQDYLSKISQSSNHLLSLINDVLDMSRIESGKMNLTEKPECLSEVIHTLRNIVQADIQAKDLDFYIDTTDISDENIICDKLRLNQVLLNILSNSIKYTPSRGTIALRLTQEGISGNGYGKYKFVIKDTGLGMNEDFLKVIFDPFTRVNSSTVSGIQGTGLGMSITKNIVDMMGGTIEIESEEGEGTETTITFEFKLAEEHQELQEILCLKDLRILVVDDDTSTCTSTAKMLRGIGMKSDWCSTGKEAIIRAKEAYDEGDFFKAFIIDWLMPDMNGIETTRRIRKVVGDNVPVIILTAYDWSDIEDEAREAGVSGFINKPLFPSDVKRVLISYFCDCVRDERKKECCNDFVGKRILLVEDNAMNREIATEILSDEGFVVEAVGDGMVAVEKMQGLSEGYYDLILMDIQMPIMDGYEATRNIRAMDGDYCKKIPIIAMTANAFDEDRQEAFNAGMTEYLAKPIEIPKLKETLAKILSDRKV